MGKGADERNFRKLKNQVFQIEEIVSNTKTNALWEHEAALRKKIKTLGELKSPNIRDFNSVYDKYIELLKYVSIRLIEDYNNKNNTNFTFESVVKGNYNSFLSSGIISVLVTKHIPIIVAREFDRIFPENPKEEYKSTRNIKRKFYLHLGDTNTGKTYRAMERLKESGKGIYLSPLRILALENFEKLNKEGVNCSLITGEEEIIIEGANHVSSTIEKLNLEEVYDIAVIDEIQMIANEQRGFAWTRALLGVKAKEVHICGALNAKEILMDIIEDCEEEYEIIEYKRDIPLIIEEEGFSYKSIEPGDALVTFSKKRVLELARRYSNFGIKSSLIYGDLPPEVRRKQYEEFIKGESSILITTDAIGMGVNLPIKRIIFMDIRKFDGREVRYLSSQEVKQIAGRAGRKGIYDKGYVGYVGNTRNFIEENIDNRDRIIEEAVIGPSDEILSLKDISLKEKLALWSTRKEKVPFYRKMDISQYIIILDNIKRYKLDQKIQWRLLKIPFDVANNEILKLFIAYIDELFVLKKDFLTKPRCLVKELYDLELYYEEINLYYSFSKAFNLVLDEEWVKEERVNVSEDINKILSRI